MILLAHVLPSQRMLDRNEEKAMLRHPFFGVIAPPDEASAERFESGDELATEQTGGVRTTKRRTFFAQALAGLTGVGALLLLGKRSVAQDSFSPGGAAGGSFDRGFSGQSGGSFRGGLGGDSFGDRGPRYSQGGGGTVTTYAIGEEGSGGTVTTYAIGEEGSGGAPSTRALGEEGGSWPPSGGATTYALGEEGSYRPPYRRYYYPYRGYRQRYTTYALGEEGRW